VAVAHVRRVAAVSVLYVLVPVALALVVTAVLAFVWAARQGQFDDTTTPSWRAVMDDDGPSVRGSRPERTQQPRVAETTGACPVVTPVIPPAPDPSARSSQAMM